MSRPEADRRSFLQKSATLATVGAVTGAVVNDQRTAQAAAQDDRRQRLPREVWIATVSQEGLDANTPREITKAMLERMREAMHTQPDIICLPELFPFMRLRGSQEITKAAEEGRGSALEPFSRFAAENNCHVVCPIYTREDGRNYNSAVFLDRRGEVTGEYRKLHPTNGEMDDSVCPGPTTPQVFETDIGRLGAQICFDMEWDDGWRRLREAGAEIVFWPSAYGGGRTVNTRAWQNRYCVVSSTHKGTSKICDIDGTVLAATSLWHRWVCAPVNLEKAFLHTWPYVQRFGDIISTYGNRVSIRTHAEEEWSILESRDPELKVATVMKEFELKTIDEHLGMAERQQLAERPS